ncbi:ROK family protein [Pedobacter nyackensis]|uniref:ROK family protein n=1 Tax=Pedobacter nyackensis TaxID=475255 RepID=UPI00292D37DD|nr:ROK family protein [Pedobacter nyackensis]
MTTEHKYVLGADIGGSHITAALLDMKERVVLEHSLTRKPINSAATCEVIMEAWAEAILEAHQKANVKLEKIGLAMPGPFDYEKGISYITGTEKYEAFYGLNIKEILATQLDIGAEAIRMRNDAESFLAGETFSGAAQDYSKVIGITLGTGLGSAIFENAEVHDANLWCAPYLESIAEDYISTRWFLKRYNELTGLNISNVKDLVALYDESDIVKQIFEEFSINLAAFLESFIRKANAEAIVIGGNISKASGKFLPGLSEALKKLGVNQPIFISEMTEVAALAGAASCWKNP